MKARLRLLLLAAVAALLPGRAATALEPLMRVVDLDVGQTRTVTLCDGRTVPVKLLGKRSVRDPLRNAVRAAWVDVEVGARRATLPVANYHLPATVGDVQIDCAVTRDWVQHDLKVKRRENSWSLDADARLRLWPAGSPWIRPGSFVYPVRQRWFASDTQMPNEPVFIDGGERPEQKEIYYHFGLDIGGANRLTEVVAATDGLVISAAGEKMEGHDVVSRVTKSGVTVIDARGWYHRYAHLDAVDPAVRMGQPIKKGQRIGTIGNQDGAGWAHLHYGIEAVQPSGRVGFVEGYAFLWQAYQAEYAEPLQAVARPHQLARTGDTVELDGTRSRSAAGAGRIVRYEWSLSDGTTAVGAKVRRRYTAPGSTSEILKVTDDAGRVDYDFTVVQVVSREHPEQVPPSIHAAYWPTQNLRAGDEITFQAGTFRVERDEGRETWDFGDGSPSVQTQSDGTAILRARDGYAAVKHRYGRSGRYLVTVSRTNRRGETATAHLDVVVDPQR